MPRVDVRGGLRRVCALIARGDATAALAQGRGLLDALDRPRPPSEGPQLELRAIARATPVKGCPLGSGLTAVMCVARQMLSDRELKRGGKPRKARSRELARHDGKRGTSTTYPSCRSEHCAVGRGTREVLGEDSEAQAMAARATRCSDTSTT